ncbi:unnamed protein product [Paramecium primaurelia]|uniref:WD40-repeat-containing domain n=1 Tax=Paramecium primaurelia TaxID=5886 RepID=A0A8S1QQ65_PARPR|nr:unnamed protein product [Paramecium primaurelia]
MQAQHSTSSQIIQYTMTKIEESFFEIGSQIEFSFAEIDKFIDSIFLFPFEQVTHTIESKLELPQFPEFSMSEIDYSQQILDSLKPLVNQITKNRIEIKEQKGTQTFFEQKIIEEKEESNKEKNILNMEIDSQNQQIKQSDSILNEVKCIKNIISKQKEVLQVENEQKQLEQQLMMNEQFQFQLIYDSSQQFLQCYAIVFNKDGSIMITADSNLIKIWNFEQGRFKLSNSYTGHTNPIYCLVCSKKTNNFISGCSYYKIICWQQINQNEWKCSQPFQQHSDGVNCLLLNKQEDQLISGGLDYHIIVWQVDFMKNHLAYLYSLDNHSNSVCSLSFNQSETLLASCGFHEFIIWEKGLQGKLKLKYKQDVSSGYKIHFINDQQFIWVTKDKQNEVFQQNSNKTITLINNNECDDDFLFPIIHNKDRNVILVRHKHHIYLIRELKDGIFNILASLNCQTPDTYGTMTNNGQYLVFWDQKQEKYSSYEILYK